MRNVVLGGLLLTGIAASVPAQAQDTVRIGLVQPLTGSVAYIDGGYNIVA